MPFPRDSSPSSSKGCAPARESPEARSSAEVGCALGISRSNRPRYLEYLAEKGEASVEYEVSDVGRPIKLYRVPAC
jgi:response regulator of citrate/malate metabolism